MPSVVSHTSPHRKTCPSILSIFLNPRNITISHTSVELLNKGCEKPFTLIPRDQYHHHCIIVRRSPKEPTSLFASVLSCQGVVTRPATPITKAGFTLSFSGIGAAAIAILEEVIAGSVSVLDFRRAAGCCQSWTESPEDCSRGKLLFGTMVSLSSTRS